MSLDCSGMAMKKGGVPEHPAFMSCLVAPDQ